MEKTYDVIAHDKHYPITQAQVDACERKIDPDTKQVFYAVKSATTQGTTYKVYFDRRFGKLACNCPAFDYPTCWHRRAATVAERIFKENMRKQYDAARQTIESSAEYHGEISKHTAEQALVAYHEGLREAAAAGDEAAARELKALKRYGNRAYDTEDFHLEK